VAEESTEEEPGDFLVKRFVAASVDTRGYVYIFLEWSALNPEEWVPSLPEGKYEVLPGEGAGFQMMEAGDVQDKDALLDWLAHHGGGPYIARMWRNPAYQAARARWSPLPASECWKLEGNAKPDPKKVKLLGYSSKDEMVYLGFKSPAGMLGRAYPTSAVKPWSSTFVTRALDEVRGDFLRRGKRETAAQREDRLNRALLERHVLSLKGPGLAFEAVGEPVDPYGFARFGRSCITSLNPETWYVEYLMPEEVEQAGEEGQVEEEGEEGEEGEEEGPEPDSPERVWVPDAPAAPEEDLEQELLVAGGWRAPEAGQAAPVPAAEAGPAQALEAAAALPAMPAGQEGGETASGP